MKKYSTLALFTVTLACVLGFTTGCDPLANIFEPIEDAQMYEAANKTPTGDPGASVLVMSWNIKFGGGRIDFTQDCFADRWLMNHAEVVRNLDAVVAKINQANPDILIMQEVDTWAHRSADVDMVQYILDRTKFNYGAYASHWRNQFIPINGLENMDSGNALLSKWPLTAGTRIALPLRTDDSTLHRQFYLKRNILMADVNIPGHDAFKVLNVHAEAYATDGTLEKHINIFKAKLDELNDQGVKFIAGGDFNDIPPNTAVLTNYPDQVCTDPDYPRDDFTPGQSAFMAPLYDSYDSAIPMAEYKTDNSPWFSFTADKDGFWNRTLDHLFTNGGFVPGSALMHQDTAHGGMETMPLSDHAPLSVRYAL